MSTENPKDVSMVSSFKVALLDHDYNLFQSRNYRAPYVIPAKKKKTCTLCFKQFRNTRTFKEHLQTVHNKMKIQCKDCPSILGSNRSLHIHYKRYHPLQPLPPKVATKQFEVIEQIAEFDAVEIIINNTDMSSTPFSGTKKTKEIVERLPKYAEIKPEDENSNECCEFIFLQNS